MVFDPNLYVSSVSFVNDIGDSFIFWKRVMISSIEDTLVVEGSGSCVNARLFERTDCDSESVDDRLSNRLS